MTKSPRKEIASVVRDIADAARAAAKKHGVKRSVTIVKGETVSKDKPAKIRVIKD